MRAVIKPAAVAKGGVAKLCSGRRNVNVASGRAPPPRHAKKVNTAGLGRREAVAVVLVASSGFGRDEAKATSGQNAAERAKATADAAKRQQDEAIARTQAKQADDVAKAEKDQAALKAFLMKLLGFGK
mmetsp:Transcript_17134/g.30625  ORF Transcript_17134/g.30625 Transcript_17134/m.30625 type:complete len:128 (-) Transcript_17134:608-991(-)|eukprot:CAMPEP_0177763122 /NCGR_PEP_ID=MMETSP0491_2-20121128/6705_1 /TAXON_ID=63592 /ORGANISM="Tetraselmis chuii, Strain PLY429" /LENGTH=127 /DNA_ID=CAMNT_0019279213 /DNA_START=128 /DNA_END=511 /DNA_ORIENTATION=-